MSYLTFDSSTRILFPTSKNTKFLSLFMLTGQGGSNFIESLGASGTPSGISVSKLVRLFFNYTLLFYY